MLIIHINQQTEINECGLLVIQYLHKFYFSKNLTINYLHSLTNLTPKGLSLNQLIDLGSLCGIKMIFYKMKKQEFHNYKLINPLVAVIKKPGINFNHFIIIYKKTDTHIYYSDSKTGKNHKVLFNNDFSNDLSYIFATTSRKSSVLNNKNIHSAIFYFFKDQSWSLLLLFLINVSLIFLTITASMFSKVLVNYLFANKVLIDIFIIILFFIVINLLKSLINFFQHNILQKLLFNFTSSLYEDVMLNLDKKPNHFFRQFNESSIIQKTQLIHQVSGFIVIKITKLFYNVFVLISILTFLLFLFVQLSIFLFMLVILFVFINYYFNTVNKPRIKEQLKLQQIELKNRLLLISQRKHLKTGSKADFLKYKWKQSFYKLQNNQFNMLNNLNNQNLFNNSLKTIVNFSIVTLVILLAIKTNKNLSFVIMMTSILSLVWSPISNISYFIADFSKDKNNFYKLSKIINYQNENISNKGFQLNKIKNITVSNLNFKYLNKPILNKVNFTIVNNTVINGSNGSGKSTLLKLIATHEKTDKILYNNLKLSSINVEKMRKNTILYTDKDVFIEELINDFTIDDRNNFWLLLFNKYHFWFLFKIMNLNISKLTIENYQYLSLGQKQFLNFLVLFKKKYLLIITDEPLSNVASKITKMLFIILSMYQDQSLIITVNHNNDCLPKSYKILEMEDINHL